MVPEGRACVRSLAAWVSALRLRLRGLIGAEMTDVVGADVNIIVRRGSQGQSASAAASDDATSFVSKHR